MITMFDQNNNLVYCYMILGTATRYCSNSGVWGRPDVKTCRTHRFIALMEEVCG